MSDNLKIGDVFDEVSSRYDSVMHEMVPHYRELIAAMFGYLPADFDPGHMLDLGCGNGNSSTVATNLFPRAKMHLVDASPDMLTICRERLGQGFTFDEVLFQDLELEEGRYDLAFACFSIHHLDGEEKRAFFKKIFSWLKGGGVFAYADLFIEKAGTDHQGHLKEWKSYCISNGKTEDDWEWLMDHYDKYDRPNGYDEQIRWIREAGFTDVKISWNEGQWGCLHATRP